MSHDEHDQTLRDAWDQQEPSPGFTDRVMNTIESEKNVVRWADRPKRRTWLYVAAPTFAVAAAIAVYGFGMRESSGEAIAKDVRTEVRIGSRAVAVLEPGAKLSWKGSLVDQSAGDVFYRVERGDGFRVHTAAGDVDVLGTCFRVNVKESDMAKRDWKMGGLGAAVASALLVGVYEGKVAVSHASERVTLSAGEHAEVTEANGVVRSGGGVALGGKDGVSATEDPLEGANRNLVDTVSAYRKRLEALEGQKKTLEERLLVAEKDLDREKRGGDGAKGKSEFDLSQEDLVALAKEGTIKYMAPCAKKGYRPEPEVLNKMGLAPQDAETIEAAYKKVNEWREARMRPACVEAIGKSELTERVPVDGCMHLLSDVLGEANGTERRDQQQLAADIRAGLKPMPRAGEKVPPLTQMMLAATGASKVLEDELAKTFGPDEAHRIVYSDELCMGHSTWGGPKK